VGGRRYLFGGFVDVPIQAIDIQHDRQLELAYVERLLVDSLTAQPLPDSAVIPGTGRRGRFQPLTTDSTWGPSLEREPNSGGREYLFVLSYGYSGGENPALARDGAPIDPLLPLPMTYALWALKRPSRPYLGDAMFYNWSTPPTPNDVFEFSTAKLVQNDASLAQSRLANIRVVPNPYYGRSRYELSQFNRVIRFINMPERATVRIFNLGGDLVRTLQKDDPTSSILTWDALTENRLPVGSGVYIYHVEVPGVGTTYGRLVVFMEKERLSNL
jgi:hypothetical protein